MWGMWSQAERGIERGCRERSGRDMEKSVGDRDEKIERMGWGLNEWEGNVGSTVREMERGGGEMLPF